MLLLFLKDISINQYFVLLGMGQISMFFTFLTYFSGGRTWALGGGRSRGEESQSQVSTTCMKHIY